MDVRELLQFMVAQRISDIHLKADSSPLIRLNGNLVAAGAEIFSPDFVRQIAYTLMNPQHQKHFEANGELDFSFSLDKVSRFRINVYRQKGTVALSLRVIPFELKPFEDLHLPVDFIKKMCHMPSGLILIAGVTGAGKTTTMNTM